MGRKCEECKLEKEVKCCPTCAKKNSICTCVPVCGEDCKYYVPLMSELKKFITDVTSGFEKTEYADFGFDLLRWSVNEPYWCVFACEYGKQKDAVGIEGVIAIGGHFCIGKEENLHEVLTVLADSGWNVKIHKNFFME